MSRIRLYLDEDVWPGLAVALREQGYDIVHAYEVDRGGLTDEEQLAYAASEDRTLLTHNSRDFAPLVVDYFFREQPHAGVILAEQLERGELIRRTHSLLRSVSAEEIKDGLRFLAEFKSSGEEA